MTVQELIDKLNTFPDKSIGVTVRGYEGGVNDVKSVALKPVYENYNAGSGYYGAHEQVADCWSEEDKKLTPVPRVHISAEEPCDTQQ